MPGNTTPRAPMPTKAKAKLPVKPPSIYDRAREGWERFKTLGKPKKTGRSMTGSR